MPAPHTTKLYAAAIQATQRDGTSFRVTSKEVSARLPLNCSVSSHFMDVAKEVFPPSFGWSQHSQTHIEIEGGN
jgi:hypothetical protein